MGAEFHIEVASVHMFSGHEWFDLGEKCDHDCRHHAQSVIAWGPDAAHYEMSECDRCGCRAWLDGRYYQERQRDPEKAGFWFGQQEWRKPVRDPERND